MRNKRCLSRLLPVKLMCTLVPLHCQEGLALEENNINQCIYTTMRVKLQNYRLHISSCKLQITNSKSQITNYNKSLTSRSHKESTNHKLQITEYKSQITNCKLQITTNHLQVIVAVKRHLGAGTNCVGHFHVTDPHC